MDSEKEPTFKQTEIGLIPEDWQLKPLDEVADVIDPHPSHRAPKIVKGGFPFAGIGDIQENGDLCISKCREIGEEFLIQQEKSYQINENTIGYGRVGTVGKVVKLRKKKYRYALSPTLAVIIPRKNIEPNYLFFSVKENSFFKQVEKRMTGTTRPAIGIQQLRKLLIKVPQFDEQLRIAKVLSDLENHIELNNKINQNLEAIGLALFKQWFVDFEFSNQEGKPYKTTGGKMQYNKDLGKDVPAEWEVTTLEKVAEFTRGFSYSGAEKSSTNGDLVFMTLNSIYEGGGFKREFSYLTSDRLKERHRVREGDIIIANTEQTKSGTLLGFPALVEFPNDYPKQVGCFSHHITKVTPYQEEMKYYLYHYLHHNQSNAVKYHTGSVIWGLDVAGFIKNEKIVIPNKQLLNRFSGLLETIFQKRLLNNKQSTNLAALRDLLLPKLMSGKIRVPINKEDVEMAVT